MYKTGTTVFFTVVHFILKRFYHACPKSHLIANFHQRLKENTLNTYSGVTQCP